MGIRFYCPQGHKLNVKAELAGKTGYCPKCGARVQIPLQSTRESSHKRNSSSQSSDPVLPSSPDEADENCAVTPPPVTQVVEEPLAETQQAEWYLNVGNQQNYGPVSKSVVIGWIKERRIGPTMLLWRQGWESWREARTVFPELEAMFSPVPPSVVPQVPGNDTITDVNVPESNRLANNNRPNAGTDANTPNFTLGKKALDEENQLRRSRRRSENKRKKQVRDIILVIVLLVAIVLLGACLGWLIRRDNSKPAEAPAPSVISQPMVPSSVAPGDDGEDDEDADSTYDDADEEEDDFSR